MQRPRNIVSVIEGFGDQGIVTAAMNKLLSEHMIGLFIIAGETVIRLVAEQHLAGLT